MAEYRIKLEIADTVIQMQSSFPLEQFTEEEREPQVPERANNFLYKGKQPPHILINVKIVKKLPQIRNAKHIFTTYHFQDGRKNWCLLKRGNTYIYSGFLGDKRQRMLVNKTFDKVTAYFLPKENKGWVWNLSDITYDFLQVLLINYFALKKRGIFTHAIGLKDLDGRGLLFAGKSGCGKSTTARIWHSHSKAMVLNDDRIIVRKLNGKLFIYGSPWHGEFSDYLASRIESAPLDKLFFIYHAPKNTVRRIYEKMAFKLLYPALFPTFWDKGCLENIISFCQDLIETVPCYRLGFVDDRKIIKFVRNVK